MEKKDKNVTVKTIAEIGEKASFSRNSGTFNRVAVQNGRGARLGSAEKKKGEGRRTRTRGGSKVKKRQEGTYLRVRPGELDKEKRR